MLIEVGAPGRDHDGIVFANEAAALSALAAAGSTSRPAVHQVVSAILNRIEAGA